MSDQHPDRRDAPDMGPADTVDLLTVAEDDRLLSALGHGEPGPDDDEVAALLAAWRNELQDDDIAGRANFEPTDVDGRGSVAPLVSANPERVPRRRGLRLAGPARSLVGIAAGIVLLAGGLTLAARNAGPNSPLWPLTTIVYSERADSLIAQQDAEQAIRLAREAITQARYTEATELLDLATARANEVHDAATAQRLLTEIAAVRGLLPGASLPPATTAPAVPPGPVTSPSGPATNPVQTGATPAPIPGATVPGLPLPLPLPSLPVLPLPTPTLLPLPLPSLPIPLLP
jgi:hypothetical protein